jgi:hypothetical protein
VPDSCKRHAPKPKGWIVRCLSNAETCTQAAPTLMQQTCFWKHVPPLLRQGMAASSGFFAWKACLHARVFAAALLRSARDCFACCHGAGDGFPMGRSPALRPQSAWMRRVAQ